MTSLWITASQKSALPSQLIWFKYKKCVRGRDTAREKTKKIQRNGCSPPCPPPPCCLRHQAGFLYRSLIPSIQPQSEKTHWSQPILQVVHPTLSKQDRSWGPLTAEPPLPPRSLAQHREATLPPRPVMDAPVPKGTQLNYELALTRSEGSGLCFH